MHSLVSSWVSCLYMPLILWMAPVSEGHLLSTFVYNTVMAPQPLVSLQISQASKPEDCNVFPRNLVEEPLRVSCRPAKLRRLSSSLTSLPMPLQWMSSQPPHLFEQPHPGTLEVGSFHKNVLSMENDILDQWVELREESSPGVIVLKRASSDIPPARGRRSLYLLAGGKTMAEAPGADDRGVLQGEGLWRLNEGTLSIELPGWSGRYRLQKPDQNTLVLITD
jgi:hypothetical protein